MTRAKRRRPARRLQTTAGLTLADLAAQCGVTPRAVRYYVERGALSAAEFRGPATRYTRDHLLRVRAILALQRDGLELDAIRRRLAAMTLAELERFAPEPPALPAEAAGLAPPPAPTYAAERWDHVALLPGLALLVRADASPAVRKLAQEIADHCAPAATS